MKTTEHFNDTENMGKRSPDSVELKSLRALLGKAKALGFSDDEIGKLRYDYRHGMIGVGK